MVSNWYPQTLLLALVLLFCVAQTFAFSGRVSQLVPEKGAWLGFSSGDGTPEPYNHSGYTAILGWEPALHSQFVSFPLQDYETTALNTVFFQEMSSAHVMLLLTLQPWNGLDSITDDSILELASIIRNLESVKCFVVLRFAHEMNGDWYPWGQQPIAYKNAFRQVATLIKNNTKYATMLWAPNAGVGYPFGGSQYQYDCNARPDDCKVMDTNGDGAITQADDMYTPFWPGADVVDWVGMSLYWWGTTYPYGQNVLPVPNIFANQMTGRATQLPASPALPNFYKMFSVAQNKPFVVAETAAFVNMCDNNKASACAQQVNPPSEYSIKQAWWEQIFNLDGSNGSESIADNFPNIKIITWFDHRKIEAEAWGNTVDWTVSINPDDIAGFTQQVKTPLVKPGQAPVKYWQFGDDLRAHFALYQKKLYSKRPKFF